MKKEMQNSKNLQVGDLVWYTSKSGDSNDVLFKVRSFSGRRVALEPILNMRSGRRGREQMGYSRPVQVDPHSDKLCKVDVMGLAQVRLAFDEVLTAEVMEKAGVNDD